VLALGAVLVQRDGYIITAASIKATFSHCVGKCIGRRNSSQSDTLSGGAFVTKTPRYGYAQLLRNMLFWTIVIVFKVRAA
jgi:hypothetical protein